MGVVVFLGMVFTIKSRCVMWTEALHFALFLFAFVVTSLKLCHVVFLIVYIGIFNVQ